MTLPVPKTETGEEETVELVFHWKVQETPPMSAEQKTQREIVWARHALQRAERALRKESEFSALDLDQLGFALAHAVRAWDRSHLEGNRCSYFDNYDAFYDAAPESLQQTVLKAQSALTQLRHFQTVTPTEAVKAVRTAVEAVLGTICWAGSEPPSPEERS